MPLYYKPHTAIRWKAVESVETVTLEVQGIYYESPVTVQGQLTPSKPNTHFDQAGVELDRPHDWLWDTADDFDVQDLVQIGERFFVVSKPQKIWDAEPITAHRQSVLTEIDPALVNQSNL
jgi:hypothetical protein